MTDLWPDAELGEMVSDGVVLSFEAAAAITKGDPVYLSADMKVSPTTGSAEKGIGIALATVAVGEFVSVCVRGVVKVTASGAITRGAAVQGVASAVQTLRTASALGDVDDMIAEAIGVALQTFANGDTGLIYVDKA